jgi:hypothetical protein
MLHSTDTPRAKFKYWNDYIRCLFLQMGQWLLTRWSGLVKKWTAETNFCFTHAFAVICLRADLLNNPTPAYHFLGLYLYADYNSRSRNSVTEQLLWCVSAHPKIINQIKVPVIGGLSDGEDQLICYSVNVFWSGECSSSYDGDMFFKVARWAKIRQTEFNYAIIYVDVIRDAKFSGKHTAFL